MQATMRFASPPAGGTWLRPRLSISRAPLVSGEGPEMPAPASGHRVLDRLQQRVVNPVVRLGWNLGIPIPGDALLETTGRRTGLPRRTPMCDGLDGERFWLISQRGREADRGQSPGPGQGQRAGFPVAERNRAHPRQR